jgi:uncharacterized protein (DUF362 family)
MITNICSRRKVLGAIGAAAGVWAARPVISLARSAPTDRVAVAMCPEYGPETVRALAKMFDQIGGLRGLVRGKTVAIKMNLTGDTTQLVAGLPLEMTHWVHPQVIGATIHLLDKAGARRIRLLESPTSSGDPLVNFMAQAKWQPQDFLSAAPRVEIESTNLLAPGKKYSRFWVPGGGLLFKGFDLSQSYEDCDVFISLAKLKEHSTAGVTLALKNCFGLTPCTVYGEHVGEDEPSPVPRGGRSLFHDGKRLPPRSAPGPVDLEAFRSRDGGYRVPRVTVDLALARPIHLSIIDGIYTAAGGEGPWVRQLRPVHSGVLIAGRNCVTTDAVATAIMGFDPMADRGTAPFENCDNTLRLAEDAGLGTRDLKRIEVVGTPISKARFDFRAA